MNLKLILQLSLFGLAMGLGTVFFIGSTIEPAFWLVIFIFCAYVIARRCPTKRFAHGVVLGLANSVWVTASHIVFFQQYLAGHAREADMMKSMSFPDDARLMMALMGPVVGVVSGIVLGVLAVIAGKLIKSGGPPSRKCRRVARPSRAVIPMPLDIDVAVQQNYASRGLPIFAAEVSVSRRILAAESCMPCEEHRVSANVY